MLKVQIAVGKGYVQEKAGLIREVIAELDSNHIRFNTFDLVTGQLTPERRQVCRKSALITWADREAKPREMKMVHPFRPVVSNTVSPAAAESELDRLRSWVDGAPAHYAISRIKG